MATSQRVEETQFKQVASIQGSTLFIDKHGANHNDSMDRLKRAGLEPLTYQQAFSTYREVLLTEAQKYFNETGNVMSFYLSGEGIKKDGYYHFDRTGELQEGRAHPDKTAYVYSGKRPLRFDVCPDHYGDRWFDLGADYSPGAVARVVVGLKASSEGAASPRSIDLIKSELDELKRIQTEKNDRAEQFETEAKQLRQEAAALTGEIENREKVLDILSPSLRV